MKDFICEDCDYCKTDRKNEQGQVRCTKFSQFVNPYDMSCKDFHREVSSVNELRDLMSKLQIRG